MSYCYYKEVPEANYLNKCPFCDKESRIKKDCFVMTFHTRDNYKLTELNGKIHKLKLLYCEKCDVCFSTFFSQATERLKNDNFTFVLKNVSGCNLSEFKQKYVIPENSDNDACLILSKTDDEKLSLSNKLNSGYKLVNTSAFTWKLHKNLVTKNNLILSCPKCRIKTKFDFSAIPVNNQKSLIVYGMYCCNCDTLYILENKLLYKYLTNNKYAKQFKLNGRYYDNYSESEHNQKLRNISEKINSFVICISILLKDKREDYFIVNNKEHENQGSNIYHYSSPEARELLTALIRKERNKKGVLYGNEYKIKYSFPETNVCDIFAPEVINIKRGGGYYSASIKERNVELIDLLIYSPISDCYEIMKSTYDKSEDYCYTDITIFRKFVNVYGNPYYGNLKDNICFIERKKYCLDFDDWKEESVLHMWGYNVSSKDNLSAEQRHTLLSELVDLEIVTVENIVSRLQRHISIHPRDISAIKKWKSDINFIIQYKVNPKRFLIAN